MNKAEELVQELLALEKNDFENEDKFLAKLRKAIEDGDL